MKIEITGATHTYSGEIENYNLNFDTPLNEEKHFMISLSHAQTGLFIASKNPLRFSSNKDIIVPKGTKQIPFEIAWLKEERVEIIAADFSSSETTLKEVNVQCRSADIKINPPEYQINNTIQLQIKFDSLPSQYSLVTKWEYDSAFLQKIGDLEVMYLTGYQSFKINKWGKSDIKIAISIKNDTLGLMYEYYKHNIKLNVPCPCKLVATEKYTCPNSIITYKIEGLLGGEEIKWKEECKNAKLSSGQDTDTAVYIAQSQGEVEVSATISYNGESTTISNKEVWAGKPTINTDLETSHVMTERTPVIIDASNEFFHYKGGISYAIEGEDAEYVTVTETDKKFKVETTIPGNKRGEIKLRLKVSNDCGEVSNLHTIAYDTLPGLEPAKAIDLFSATRFGPDRLM